MPQPEATNVPFTTLVSGSFTGTGTSANFLVQKTDFTVALYGTFNATVQLNVNRNNGAGFVAVSSDPTSATGTPAAYTGPVVFAVFEPIIGSLYQWQCTAFTSGPVNFEIQG